MTLQDYCDKVAIANEKWWLDIDTRKPINRNIGEMLMLVTSELVEALEGDRKSLMDDKLPQYKMFDVEIIDALIRLFDIAGHLIDDVDAIFEAKMNYNSKRADHTLEQRKLAQGKKY